MVSWRDIAAAEPEFAAHVRRTFAVRKHATEDSDEDDPGSWLGDGKIAGVAAETSDSGRIDEAHRFRLDITEVVLTTVGSPADHLQTTC